MSGRPPARRASWPPGSSTQTQVDQAVAAQGDDADGVPIAVEAIAGHPGQVLCSAADGAALLVVGHRGRGAVASAIIGSVGMHCVLHARCLVAIVRPDA
jgi:nucleotide-binding universal stress UspA family protein